MPRIRTTKPSFFRHEELQELEIKYPHAKIMLVFQGLWGLCDNQGRFEWRPKQIKLDVLPFIPYDPEETLTILAQHNFIEKYKHGEELYGHVFNLKKHQRFSGKEVKEGERFPAPKPDSIIEIPKKEATEKHQGSIREEKKIPVDNQIDDWGSNGEAMGKHPRTQEKEKEKEKEKENPRNDISALDDKQAIVVGVIKSEKIGKNFRRGSAKKNNSEVEPHQDVYVMVFEKNWSELRKTKYNWQPKDFASIKKISKILRQEKEEWTRELAKEEFEVFIKKAKRDTFISKNNFENFTFPFFLNRVNSILSINISSNGQHGKSTTGSVGKTIEFDRP